MMKSTTTLMAGFLLTGLGFACVTGCSGDEEDRVPVYEVSGTVTYDGQAVEGAQVVFVPTGGEGSPATGSTGPDGTYKLTTYASGDGAPANDYKVKITKMTRPPGGDAPADSGDEEEDLTQNESYAPPGAGEPAWIPENLLPKKYAKADDSGLTATVTADGDNTFDFSLSD